MAARGRRPAIQAPAPNATTDAMGYLISVHGYGGYSRGCRCETCRDAKAAYMRDTRVTYKPKGSQAVAARGRRPAIQAPRERWIQLGEQMQRRRAQLGYETRAAMARATGRPKRERTITDLEKGYRDTFQLDTLEWFTEIYQVTFASVRAFLAGEADELEPAAPPAARPSAGIVPPLTDPERRAAAVPYFNAIWVKIVRYMETHPGVRAEDIPGTALFPDDPADARTWDDPNLRLLFDIDQLVMVLAGVRSADAGRSSGGNSRGLVGA